MSEKVTGYALIIIGLLIIAISAYSVYLVFTSRKNPVDIFTLPGISIDLGNLAGQEIPQDLKSQDLKTELVGSDIINKPLNLFAHIIFMGFILNVGFKISSIGVQLVRPIKVKLKTDSKSILEP